MSPASEAYSMGMIRKGTRLQTHKVFSRAVLLEATRGPSKNNIQTGLGPFLKELLLGSEVLGIRQKDKAGSCSPGQGMAIQGLQGSSFGSYTRYIQLANPSQEAGTPFALHKVTSGICTPPKKDGCPSSPDPSIILERPVFGIRWWCVLFQVLT